MPMSRNLNPKRIKTYQKEQFKFIQSEIKKIKNSIED